MEEKLIKAQVLGYKPVTSMTPEAVRGHSTLLQEEVQLKFKLPLRPQNIWPPRPPRSFEAVFRNCSGNNFGIGYPGNPNSTAEIYCFLYLCF